MDVKTMNEYYKMAQGPATEATAEDIAKDEEGITKPNLHRRIDPKQPQAGSEEYKPRDYKLNVSNLNSYKQTTINTHDEDGINNEIP